MRYLLEEAFSNIRHGGIVSFLSVVIITLTIATAAAFALIVNYLNEEVKGLKNEPAIIAFLKCTLDGSEGRELRSQIEKFDRITSVVYVSKAAALARSGQAFGELGEIIMQGFEDINPLPASLEIHLKDSSLNRDLLEQLVLRIKSFQQIEDVTYEQSSSDFIRKVEMVIIGLGGLMGGASVIIVCFSIMLTAYFRREEIRIMKLVGATYWYIRIPLIIQGGFLGFLGSALGISCFYVLFLLLTRQFDGIAFLPFNQLLLILLIGILLGFWGSILPLRKYVNV
jgi:cell division transport system permease protein